ncbi:MAG TPA: hypothetical protein VGS05_09820 [Candidatus Sulfotelmatobacter sp.]|nr:hypothetical protein [Candidatus Sulfotelmatobacter sp.]
MATTLATILVGLGYDLSGLEKGSPEAFRLINQQTLNMSSEMKRSARDGSEAFRSIDEMLGIHINRPMTRLLVETFPAFGKALQSALGGVAFGAVAFAGVELFDKVTSKIAEARAAQEKLAESSKTTNETITDVLGGIQKKILELTSNDKTLRIRLEGAEEAKQGIDQIEKALAAEQMAAEKANAFWTRLTAGSADFFDHVFEGWTEIIDLFSQMNGLNLPSAHDAAFGTQAFSNMKDTLNDMRDAFDEALNSDRFKGTHEALTLAQNDIKIATAYLHDMQAAGDKAGITLAENALRFYQTSLNVEKGVSTLEADEKAKAAEEALKKEVAAIQEADGATQKWAESLKKVFEAAKPPEDQYAALDAAVKKNVISLTNLWNRIGPISFRLRFDGKSLEEVEQQMASLFKITAPEIKLPSPALPASIATASPLSTLAAALAAGGTTGAEFDTFAKDQTAQVKLLSQAYADLVTPEQKFHLAQQELDLILKNADGTFKDASHGAEVYTAALQKAREEMAKSTDALEKMLEKGGLSGGWQAFKLQLEGQGSKGSSAQNTFDMLNKGLQGFEEETAQVLTGARSNWRSFFLDLDQMALKFMLNKMFASLLTGGGLGNLFGGFFGGGAGAATNIGSISQAAGGGGIGLGSVVPGYAAGTDFAPGGLAWVGEQGPELMNVPAGASITPSSMLRSGAMPAVNLNIDAKGGEIGVEEKIARAVSAALPHAVMRAVVESAEVQRRTPH